MQKFEFGDKVWFKVRGKVADYIGTDTQGTPHHIKIPDDTYSCGYTTLWCHDSDIEPYTNQDKPKLRPMTRDEILHFVTTTPGLVVKREPGAETRPATFYRYEEFALRAYEWAHASSTGDYKWNKFEVEE